MMLNVFKEAFTKFLVVLNVFDVGLKLLNGPDDVLNHFGFMSS